MAFDAALRSDEPLQVSLDRGCVAARATNQVDRSGHQRPAREPEDEAKGEQGVGQWLYQPVAVDVEDGEGLEAPGEDAVVGIA